MQSPMQRLHSLRVHRTHGPGDGHGHGSGDESHTPTSEHASDHDLSEADLEEIRELQQRDAGFVRMNMRIKMQRVHTAVPSLCLTDRVLMANDMP